MRGYGAAIAIIGFGLATLMFGMWQEVRFKRHHYAIAPTAAVDVTGSIVGRK